MQKLLKTIFERKLGALNPVYRKQIFPKDAREAINKLLDELPPEGKEQLQKIIKHEAESRRNIEAFRNNFSKKGKERNGC